MSRVESLPRRVAHAVHALMEARNGDAGPYGPYTAAEVCIFDGEAVSPRATAAALREAQRRYWLAAYVGNGLWTATGQALDLRAAFEARYLRDTAEAENGQSRSVK